MRGRKKRRRMPPGRQGADSPEWVKLYSQLYPRVRSWLLARVADRQDAEDLAQEVLARLARSATPHDVNAYLATAAVNALARHQRRRARERDFLRTLLEEVSKADGTHGSESDEDESTENHARVEEVLNTLPREQARLLRLRFLEGLRMAEVARRVGCSREVAYKRLQRVIRRLRERYGTEPPTGGRPKDAENS
jgi:RNA polymerase sigma-70 factor (ECF subfamily)